MAKRKSLNRRSGRYSKQSIGSAILDPDTGILDDEQPFWWKNLDNNTFVRPSTDSNVINETTAQLDGSSQLGFSQIKDGWWKVLEDSEISDASTIVIYNSTKENVMDKLQSSESESVDEPQIEKRKLPLRKVARKSEGNAFLDVLNNSKISTASGPIQKSWETSMNKSGASDELPSRRTNQASKKNQKDNIDQSQSADNILKPKPKLFRKKHLKSNNASSKAQSSESESVEGPQIEKRKLPLRKVARKSEGNAFLDVLNNSKISTASEPIQKSWEKSMNKSGASDELPSRRTNQASKKNQKHNVDQSQSADNILKPKSKQFKKKHLKNDNPTDKIQSSESETVDEPQIEKRKLPLRKVARKSEGNAFLDVLNNSKTSVASEPAPRTGQKAMNRSEVSNEQHSDNQASKRSRKDSTDQSENADVILKLRPKLFRKKDLDNSQNPIVNLSKEHESHSPSTRRSNRLSSGNISKRIIKGRKSIVVATSQNQESRMTLSFDGEHDSSQFLVPKAQSTILDVSTLPTRNASVPISESDTDTEIIKPKSRFLRRHKKSLGENAFEHILSQGKTDEEKSKNISMNSIMSDVATTLKKSALSPVVLLHNIDQHESIRSNTLRDGKESEPFKSPSTPRSKKSDKNDNSPKDTSDDADASHDIANFPKTKLKLLKKSRKSLKKNRFQDILEDEENIANKSSVRPETDTDLPAQIPVPKNKLLKSSRGNRISGDSESGSGDLRLRLSTSSAESNIPILTKPAAEEDTQGTKKRDSKSKEQSQHSKRESNLEPSTASRKSTQKKSIMSSDETITETNVSKSRLQIADVDETFQSNRETNSQRISEKRKTNEHEHSVGFDVLRQSYANQKNYKSLHILNDSDTEKEQNNSKLQSEDMRSSQRVSQIISEDSDDSFTKRQNLSINKDQRVIVDSDSSESIAERPYTRSRQDNILNKSHEQDSEPLEKARKRQSKSATTSRRASQMISENPDKSVLREQNESINKQSQMIVESDSSESVAERPFTRSRQDNSLNKSHEQDSGPTQKARTRESKSAITSHRASQMISQNSDKSVLRQQNQSINKQQQMTVESYLSDSDVEEPHTSSRQDNLNKSHEQDSGQIENTRKRQSKSATTSQGASQMISETSKKNHSGRQNESINRNEQSSIYAEAGPSTSHVAVDAEEGNQRVSRIPDRSLNNPEGHSMARVRSYSSDKADEVPLDNFANTVGSKRLSIDGVSYTDDEAIPPTQNTNLNVPKNTATSVKSSSIQSTNVSKGQTNISQFFRTDRVMPASQVFSDKQKTEEIRRALNKIKKREMINMKIGTAVPETKQIPMKKVMFVKSSVPVRKEPKPVDKAFLVNGKVYKVPRLPRPKYWVTNRLYQYLWKHMEPKYKLETRVRSEKFVQQLSEVTTLITRRKTYANYSSELEALMKEMARLGIIRTRNDFHIFCHEFLPYELKVKMIPMLMPGNKRNIPLDPETLHDPILE